MTNLRNYVNFSLDNHPPIQLGAVKLEPFGRARACWACPATSRRPSRFVRAVAFSQSVLEPQDWRRRGARRVSRPQQLRHPKGAAREAEKDEHGNILADYTLWTSASDLKAKRFYFRTYEDSRIRMVDLTKMNLDAKDIVTFSMQGEETFQRLNP